MLHGTATGFLAGFLGLSSSCLGFCFLTGFLGSLTSLSSSTFSGSFRFRTTLGLSSSTCLLAGHFLSDQSVNLGIQCRIFLFLLGDDVLDRTLFLLQALHHILLFRLFAFQVSALPFTLYQELCLLTLGNADFLEFVIDRLLLGFYLVTLYMLVGRILTHEAHSAHHLRQVVGTEDEHQLTLVRLVTMQVAHGLHITALALVQFVL